MHATQKAHIICRLFAATASTFVRPKEECFQRHTDSIRNATVNNDIKLKIYCTQRAVPELRGIGLFSFFIIVI